MARKIPADAFESYFAMGAARSYQTLADKYGVSKKAITLMAKRERWQERILELEAKARETTDKKMRESMEEHVERTLTALRFIKAKAIETLKQKPIETAMDAVRAYHSSLREERVILGEPTDRTALTIEDVIKREYSEWLLSDGTKEKNGETSWDDEDDTEQLDPQPR